MYAKCPYKYFLNRVLWVKVQEDPDRVTRVSGMHRGAIFHRTVDGSCTSARRRRTAPPRAPAPRTSTACARSPPRSAGGRGPGPRRPAGAVGVRPPPPARGPRALVRGGADRPRLLRRVEFEAHFGENEGAIAPPLEIEAGGVKLRFNGYIDRLDWKADRSAFRVIDYKTGWRDASLKDGQLKHGEALQLPLYVRAGAEILGIDYSRGSAQYYYSSRRGGFKRTQFTGEKLVERDADLRQVLGTLATGIGKGDFHPVPAGGRRTAAGATTTTSATRASR